MKSRDKQDSRPERILLLVAQREGDCRGKAVRFSDQTEIQFQNLEELNKWLVGRDKESEQEEF